MGINNSCTGCESTEPTVAEVNGLLGNLKDCAGTPLEIGDRLVKCEVFDAAVEDLNDAIAAEEAARIAGGAATLASALAADKDYVDCSGTAIVDGAALATCANLNDALVDVLSTAIAADKDYVDCSGTAIADGAALATCANLNTALQNLPFDLNGFTQFGVGAVTRPYREKIAETVTPQDFGAVGDGVADDTTALQAAIDHCDANRFMLDLKNLRYKITAGLVSTGHMYGIVNGRAGLLATGGGYTVLTIGTGSPFAIKALEITVSSDRAAPLNGILLNNPIASKIDDVRVHGCDGFGLKINKTWDTLYSKISIEECGNLSDYAFSMNDDGDTSNMSHILQLQVEFSHNKAIYISPNTLSCVFDNIHSERLRNFDNSVTAWVLGGSGCQYNLGRFHALNPGAKLRFDSGSSVYIGMRLESALDITVVSYGTLGLRTNFITPNFINSGQVISIPSSNQEQTVFKDGVVLGQLNVANRFRAYNMSLNSVDVGFTSAASNMRFVDCQITTLTSSSVGNSATFDNCQIADAGNLLQGITYLRNSTVTNPAGFAINYRRVWATNTEFVGNVTLDNASIRSQNCTFTGNISVSAGGNQCLFDGSTYCTGTVSGVNAAPVAGAYIGTLSRGMRHKNIYPAVGSPKAWVYDGTTFISEGNL